MFPDISTKPIPTAMIPVRAVCRPTFRRFLTVRNRGAIIDRTMVRIIMTTKIPPSLAVMINFIVLGIGPVRIMMLGYTSLRTTQKKLLSHHITLILKFVIIAGKTLIRTWGKTLGLSLDVLPLFVVMVILRLTRKVWITS